MKMKNFEIYEIANEFLSPVISELFSANDENNAISELRSFFGGTEKMTEAAYKECAAKLNGIISMIRVEG